MFLTSDYLTKNTAVGQFGLESVVDAMCDGVAHVRRGCWLHYDSSRAVFFTTRTKSGK